MLQYNFCNIAGVHGLSTAYSSRGHELIQHICFHTAVWVTSASIEGDPWCLKMESISGRLQENVDLPEWVGDCVLKLRLPTLEEWKCSFTLRPVDVGNTCSVLIQMLVTCLPKAFPE